MKRSYKRKSADGSIETTPKTPKTENELEVTGVSRSGRVRKKSSKLIDYESGAEEADRPKRKSENVTNIAIQRATPVKNQSEEYEIDYTTNEELGNSNSTQQLSDSEQEASIYTGNDGFDDSSVDTSGTEVDDDLLDDKLNASDVSNVINSEVAYGRSSNTNISTSQKSLYMLEKFAKKKKTGPGAGPGSGSGSGSGPGPGSGRGSKAGRKDKGKARFSAYMLWAREVRPDLMKLNPNIDFSQLSSKLSDLWATVPYTDKYMWKQKAKRMAMQAKNSDSREEANIHKAQIKTTLRKKFISNNKSTKTPSSTGRGTNQGRKNLPVPIEVNNSSTPSGISISDARSNSSDSANKNINTEPLDVAAHLKLLGDSMSLVGNRLKDHQGAIAVSGSLSVLLDTLLCSMGPLLCLTQQVEEMNGCSKETLSRILDNIAYIMPGL